MAKPMSKQINAAIYGATGYGGIELIRILSQHPNVTIKQVISRSEDGQKVADIYQNARDVGELVFTAPDKVNWDGIDVCFFATPHTVAMSHVAELLSKGIKVIDLSADFRLQDVPTWEKWYNTSHSETELLKEAVYGLPELNRQQIKNARLIACPGCYPTSVILGLMPLLTNNLVDESTIIADVKSGVSGAGRSGKIDMLFAERTENFSAYASGGHRHYPEIKAQLEGLAQRSLDFIFMPHLLPMTRGIHATIYAKLKAPSDVQSLYEQTYANEPFVDVMASGQHPQTKSVRGTNMARIAIANPPDSDYVTILVVEDNLTKGASGQAVQCMNLLFDLPETSGLTTIALA